MIKLNAYSRLRLSELLIRGGGVFWRSIQYPDIPYRDEDIYYKVVSGDRPDTVSYRFYKTSRLGWYIMLANGIKYWGDIRVGDEIRIPPLSQMVNYMSGFIYK